MISSQHIIVAAAIKGSHQPLVDFVDEIRNTTQYIVSGVEYDVTEGIESVKFQVGTTLLGELAILIDICCADLKIPKEDLFNTRVRNRKVTFGRDVIIFILRYRLYVSSYKIQKLLNVHHSMVWRICHRRFGKFKPSLTYLKKQPLEVVYEAVKKYRLESMLELSK